MPRKSDSAKKREGYGTGELENYRAYLKPHEFSSTGETTRLQGFLINRMFTVFSKIEKLFFFFLEFNDEVYDIWEQFPLDIAETRRLAYKHGIKHAQYNGVNVVFTTDFVVTFKGPNGHFKKAFAIKASGNITKRTVEKLQIEKSYWESKNINFYIITEKQLPQIIARNLDDIRLRLKSQIALKHIEQLKLFLQSNTPNQYSTLHEVANSFAKSQRITAGNSKETILYAFAKKIIRFDLTKEFNWDMPMYSVSM